MEGEDRKEDMGMGIEIVSKQELQLALVVREVIRQNGHFVYVGSHDVEEATLGAKFKIKRRRLRDLRKNFFHTEWLESVILCLTRLWCHRLNI